MRTGLAALIAGMTAATALAAGTILLILDQPSPPAALTDDARTASIPQKTIVLDKQGSKVGRLPAIAPATPEAASPLADGLDALTKDDARAAMALRDRMVDGLERHILSYAIAVSGLPDVSAAEIDNVRATLGDWPGLQSLRRLEERALLRDKASPETVLALLGETRPETPEGTIALGRALMALGKAGEARALISQLWVSDILYPALESRILADFPDLLTPADHKGRMLMLLFAEKTAQASLYAVKAKAEPLHEAFAAVIAKSADAASKIKTAEAAFPGEPALLYAKIRNLRQKQKYVEAAKLLEAIPRDPKTLIRPSEWWAEQRIVSRGLVDAGKAKQAYAVVSHHVATSPEDVVEAEFHAGWYALRALKDPARAEKHFAAILRASDRPIAVARGFFWLGRAAEAAGSKNAAELYAKAATLSGTFYGQLAAARLGMKKLAVFEPVVTQAVERQFNSREAVRAIAVLRANNHGHRAPRLIRALAGDISNPSEIVLLHRLATDIGGQSFALEIGKLAYGRGLNVPTLAWPIGAIPDNADTSGSGKALAYAVARQESAFNPSAVSPANAFGLLQLLPATAKQVAGRHKMEWRQELLLTDPAYNATLGAHYLGEQINEFDGSYILTLVAYNAGPKRVKQWIARYGDPRGKTIDQVVDWIERIPFSETRHYVQRVMENYQVYKARLGDIANIESDLVNGRNP